MEHFQKRRPANWRWLVRGREVDTTDLENYLRAPINWQDFEKRNLESIERVEYYYWPRCNNYRSSVKSANNEKKYVSYCRVDHVILFGTFQDQFRGKWNISWIHRRHVSLLQEYSHSEPPLTSVEKYGQAGDWKLSPNKPPCCISRFTAEKLVLTKPIQKKKTPSNLFWAYQNMVVTKFSSCSWAVHFSSSWRYSCASMSSLRLSMIHRAH